MSDRIESSTSRKAQNSNSARNRFRDRKINKHTSLVSPVSPDTSFFKSHSDTTDSKSHFEIRKPLALGSLEDVTGEEHYLINDVKHDRITPPNLHEIKARNSLLVKKELSAIKTQLKLPQTQFDSSSLLTETKSPLAATINSRKPEPLETPSSPVTPQDKLAKILQNENFAVMKMLDRLPLSAIKPQTPYQLHSIFSQFTFMECLLAMITNVVSETTQISTIFRDNRLTYKLIDSFMAIHAGSYLATTLKPVLNSLLRSKEPFEIDPRYLEVGEDLSENITHVIEIVDQITTSIYNSSSRIPRY